MFHLHFEANQQPLDDFQCIGALLQGRPLLIYCSVKAPQRPDTRHRRHMVDAIEQRQGRRLWSLLSNFYPPPSLYDRRGNEVNPLLLALQSAEAGVVHTAEDFSMLSILLAARCDPNVQGEARQSPLLYAIGIQDKEAVEDLLIAKANADCAPVGLEPPLCVAVRHRMGDIAKVLLSYHADVEARSLPTGPGSDFGPTATELAAEDPALAQLFRAHASWRTRILDIEEAD